MAKVLKLGTNEDIAEVIQMIKASREREIVLDTEKGSPILLNSANLRLVRKTAEVLGKSVQLKTNDATGKILAVKAGMALVGGEEIGEEIVVPGTRPVSQNPKTVRVGGLSDLRRTRRTPVRRTTPQIPVKKEAPIFTKVPGIEAFKKMIPGGQQSAPTTVAKPFAAKQQSEGRLKNFAGNYSKAIMLGVVALVVIVFALVVLLPQAEIIVYARSEPITRDLEIAVDRTAKSVDSGKLVIPGEIITKELSDTKTFQTSGVKQIGDKAAGTVRIYNFTKNTLTLKASTTTLLINGKKYYFTKDATGIRPTATIGQGEEQEVDQSSLTAAIPIVAEVAGEPYNLSANQKFEIVNAALGISQNVYAINEVPLTGGTTKTINILSQADVDRAVTEMTDHLATLAEEELAQDPSSAGKKVLPTGSNKEILAKTANKNVGDEAKEFDMTIIGRLTGLAYNEDSVESVMLDRINAVLSEDRYLLENGKRDITARFKTIDLPKGVGVLSVHFETVVAYRVITGDLSNALEGKTASEIKEILLTKPEIDRVDVNFSPFFVNKAPRFNGKIYIKTQLSQG